jgi:hypothetical protein
MITAKALDKSDTREPKLLFSDWLVAERPPMTRSRHKLADRAAACQAIPRVRVFDFQMETGSGKMFEIRGNIKNSKLRFEPVNFRVKI